MVSNLYSAKSFYVKQKEGSIAKSYGDGQKLQKDTKGFYLNRSKSNGDSYKQRVSQTDLVYTRAETGVTLYSKERDEMRKSSSMSESKKDHSKHAQFGDRKRGNGVYRV